MLRKILVRLLTTCVMLFMALTTALVLAGYLALQPPGFYAELRDRPIPVPQNPAVRQEMQAIEYAFRLWLEQSIARQHTASLTTTSNPAGSDHHGYDPTGDVHTVRVTQDMLNAALAGDDLELSRELQGPRICISSGRIEFAFELVTDEIRCVPSAVLEPTLTPNGDLRIDIARARIGQLPIPLNTILSCLPRDITCTGRNMDVHLIPPTPHITLHLTGRGPHAARVHSIECTTGAIVVTFLPPVIGHQTKELAAL
jgi:hypothetical protein